VLKAEWANFVSSSFLEELVITGTDKGQGVILAITETINKFGLNIKSFTIAGNEGVFEGLVKLEIRDLDQLNALIKALKNIPYISNVRRSN
jgi:(p)ppGpp synthase/HD superfamily hydrolase